MAVSLLTYNVLYNRAWANIEKVLSLRRPDILSLQEIDTDEENLKQVERHGFKLADYSNSFIKFGKVFGLATFYNPETLEFVDSASLDLPRSYYEFLLLILRGGNNPRTVLKTEFTEKKSNKKVTCYNLHLSPLGTNGIRIKQIKATLDDLHIGNNQRVLISGDFNYPFRRKQFEEVIDKFSLKEATSNIFSTFDRRILKFFPIQLKLDYILYKNLDLVGTEKILIRNSDHYPIISEFKA